MSQRLNRRIHYAVVEQGFGVDFDEIDVRPLHEPRSSVRVAQPNADPARHRLPHGWRFQPVTARPVLAFATVLALAHSPILALAACALDTAPGSLGGIGDGVGCESR